MYKINLILSNFLHLINKKIQKKNILKINIRFYFYNISSSSSHSALPSLTKSFLISY